MSAHWARRRLITGLVAILLSPVLAAFLSAPVARGGPPDPVPSVAFVNAPASALIGSTVSFDVKFWNTGDTTGYGPYIDLRLPLGVDGESDPLNPDGLTFVSATYLGVPVTATELTANGSGEVTHPYALTDAGLPLVVTGLDPGQKYVVLRLPFGSFTVGQPAAVVHLTLSMSSLANVGVPLAIGMDGGFQFGRTPVNDPTEGDPSTLGSIDTTNVTPTIMLVTKTYNGPTNENAETATGPDFPESYTITVTVAPHQFVDYVTIDDTLPDSIQYISTNAPTLPTKPYTSITEPPTATPGGDLIIDFGRVEGGVTGASATFNFSVPRLRSDATPGTPVVDPATGAFGSSTDTATANGWWVPLDDRDTTDGDPIYVTASPASHILTDKSIAVQKSRQRVVGSGPIGPDNVIEWTIDVQVSDYFALNNIHVDDLLGDGTRFDDGFVPTLEVIGNGFGLPATGMQTGNFDHTTPDLASAGKTSISFRVSDELSYLRSDPRLIGGCIDPVTGTDQSTGQPDCARSHTPTTFRIVYRSVIQKTYIDGKEVVEGDSLTNLASAYGTVLDPLTFASTDNVVGDGSSSVATNSGAGASIDIQRGTLTKTIYAIDGSTNFDTPVHIAPGSTVTYELKQEFPSSRTDNFSVTDFLPLPIFHAADFPADPGGLLFDTAAAPGTIPESGYANYGLDDDFHDNAGAPTPTISHDTTANSITFTYGDYALYPAAESFADILFTVTVSTDPFADGLLLTNQARSQTENSVPVVQTADAIVQITLDQPVLSITKGVVGTDNPAGVFTPPLTDQVAFPKPVAPTGTPTCPAFTDGPVTSALLDPVSGHPLVSDLSGVDGGDYVRFAVVVQDTGHAGAFQVQIKDTIPDGFVKNPAHGFDMCITNGAGTQIHATNLDGDGNNTSTDAGDGAGLFTNGIQLVDPPDGTIPDQIDAALAPGISGTDTNSTGTNLVVITYTLQVDTSAVPSSVLTNTASLIDFSNDPTTTHGHLASSLTDDASVTIAPPAIAKSLHATGRSKGSSVTIGEIVTYQLVVSVPEGTMPDATVVDTLPTGLAYYKCDPIGAPIQASTGVTTWPSDALDTACSSPTVGTGGDSVTFDLGTVTNADTTNSTLETITITYQAIVLNAATNNAGTTLQNSAALSWTAPSTDGPVTLTLNAPTPPVLTVIEPTLTVQKTATLGTGDPGDAGDTVLYTITVTNPTVGADATGADAFDVTLTDTLPDHTTYDAGSPFHQTPGGPAVTLSVVGTALSATWDEIPQGQSAVLQYTVTLDESVTPHMTITNTAHVAWTSLPGDVTANQIGDIDGSTERTGNTDNPGGALNDYRNQGAVDVHVPSATVSKSLTHTDQDSTTGDNVAIGEVLTYAVVITVPEGTMPGATVVDTLPAGLAYVGCDSIAPSHLPETPSDVSLAPNDFAYVCANPTVTGNGGQVTFDLGTVTNANTDNETPETITITYKAVVLNVPTNLRGQPLHNNVLVSWTGGSASAAAEDVTVVEPAMTMTKTVDKATGDAGDEFQFTIVIANPSHVADPLGADAFDAHLSDTIPVGMTYEDGSLDTTSCATAPSTGPDLDGPPARTLTADWLTFAQGGSCTIKYKATLDADVPSGSKYKNVADLAWTSLPGIHNTHATRLSTFNDLSTERTGDTGDPGTTANTYARSDNKTVTVTQPAPVKSVIATSEPGTTGNTYLAIGEIVRYRVSVIIPEGSTPNVSVQDKLDAGLRYLNDGTTKVAFVTNDLAHGRMTSSTADIAGNPQVTGNETWILDSGNHPSFALPQDDISGGTGGTGSLYGFQSGQTVSFDLGDLTNADRDDDKELVVIEFNVLVDNVIGNQAPGTSLHDRASLWTGSPVQTKSSDSNQLTQTVAEPIMTMHKTITTGPTDAGDEIDYKIVVANASTAHAPAYDYDVTDTVPATLVSPPTATTADCALTASPYTESTYTPIDTSSGDSIDIDFPQIDPGYSCTITVKTNVKNAEPAGESFTNTAEGLYSSLPGVTGTAPGDDNATGSSNPGDPGTATGERTGTDHLVGLNNYYNTDNAATTLAVPSIVKYAPSLAHAPIGAEPTFDLVVTLPEGTTRGLVVTDYLPHDGLDPVSWTVVTTGGRLGADFSGAGGLAVPTVDDTHYDATHRLWTFTFGDTVVPANNDPSDDSFEIQITTRVANINSNQAGTLLTNSASVTYNDPASGDPVSVSAPASQTVTVYEPALTLNKTVSTPAPFFGASETYTLTLRHDGSATDDTTAYDVHLVDTLPVDAGWTYAGSLDTTACQGTGVSAVYDSGTVTVTIGTFPIGDTCVVTYHATIGTKPDAKLKDVYDNTAVATWTSLSGDSDNERTGADGLSGLNNYWATHSAEVTVSGVDMVLTKSDGTDTAIAGAHLPYAIHYVNNGNITATNVVITETVPTGTTFNSAGSTGRWLLADNVTACPNGSAAGTVCHINVGSVPANGSGNYTFAVIVPDPIPGGMTSHIINTAVISETQTDATPADNTAVDDDYIPQADLRLTKTVDIARPYKNQTIVYTVTLYNDGPDDATGVTVTDAVPASVTVSVATPPDPGIGNTYVGGLWTIAGTFPAYTHQTLTITATATTSADGWNVAEVTSSDDGDPNSTPGNHVTAENDYASVLTHPLSADMSIVKTVDNAHPDKGATVTFTLVAKDNCPGTSACSDNATGVTVADTLPAKLTLVSATPSAGTSWSAGTWTIGTLTPGSTATLTIVATVTTSGAATNTATVSELPFDPVAGNNTSSASVSQTVNLVVTKTVNNATPNVGATITFTVGVTNNKTNTANNVVLTDALPAGLTLGTATPSQGAYDTGTHKWAVGVLGPGASASMTMTATVVGVTVGGNQQTMTNQVIPVTLDETQTSTGDDNPSVNVLPQQADLKVTKSVLPTNPEIGGTVVFTVGLLNNGGPDTATNVTLSDVLPVGLTYVSDTGAGAYNHNTGVWTVGSLAKNASRTLQITATVSAGGTYTNTASVATVDQYDPDHTNNSASATLTTRTADVGVTKTVDHPAPNVGDTIHYTLTATNHGPTYGVTLLHFADPLPSGVAYVSDNSGGTYNSATGDWNVGSVGVNASATIIITARVTASGHIVNTVTFTSMLQTDTNSADNTASAAIDVPLAADLAVTKTVDNSRPNVGSNATFTITATNNGPDNATGVTVTDPEPAGLTVGTATPSAGTWAPGTWTIGNLANGASATLKLICSVDTAGLITNTATIQGAQYDPVGTNNSAGDSVDQRVNVVVGKTVSDATPNVGDTITFTVTITNPGPNTANGILIHDALPTGLTLGTATPSPGSYDAVTHNWTLGTIAASGSANMTMTATVVGVTVGGYQQTMTNTATLTHVNETQTSTLDDTKSVDVTPLQADLQVTKTVDHTNPEIGGNVVFTVTVLNNGPDAATNVALTDQLPSGLTYVSDDGSYNSTTGVWTVGTLAKNASATLHITAAVSEGGTYTNTATVTASDQYDPDSTNNHDSATLSTRAVDVEVQKTVDHPNPSVGDTIHYTLTAINHGPDYDVTLLKLMDKLPDGLAYVSDNGGGKYNHTTGVWNIGNLALGDSVSIIIAARVTASGEIDNTVTLQSMLQTDTDDSDNTATAPINSATAADLAIVKTVDVSSPNVHSDITYTLTATNNGPDDATSVKVTDTLPGNVTFVSATTATGSWSAGTWDIGNLANGATATLDLKVSVDKAGSIANSAAIAGDQYDPVSANNTDTVTTNQSVTLALAKTVNDPTPNVGDSVTFTVSLANHGTNTATNVVINDKLPAGLTYVSDDGATAYDHTSGDWTVASIATGATVRLHIVATIDPPVVATDTPAPVTNTATVTSVDEHQSDTDNDSASALVTPKSADLEVTKEVDNANPEIGDTVNFTVTLKNRGPDTATNVTLSDPLPDGLTWPPSETVTGYNDTTGVWTVGTLAKNATATLHLAEIVAVGGDHTNTASVTHSDQYDPNTTNNSGSAFLTTRVADVGVTKTVNNAAPKVGQQVVYTIKATNDPASDPASHLVIHDALPAGKLTFVKASATEGTYDSTSGDWTVGSLAPGGSATLTLTAMVIDSGPIDNTAAVSHLLQRDNNPDNNSSTVEIVAPPAADLALTKTAGNDKPDKDSNVTFTLTVANNGPDDTTGVVVSDPLPAGLTYVSDNSAGAYDPKTGHWTVGSLANGAHTSLQITAKVGTEEPVTNTAEIFWSDLYDPNSTPDNHKAGENDQQSVTLNTNGAADLSLAKAAKPATVVKGGETTYSIVVTNHGPDAATGVIVRDQLPTGVTYASSSGGKYDSKTGAWTVGNLAVGHSATLKITVRVGKSGTITNTATIVASDQRDPNPSNDAASAAISGAVPTPPTTTSNESPPTPQDPAPLVLWVAGIFLAGIALITASARISLTTRIKPRH